MTFFRKPPKRPQANVIDQLYVKESECCTAQVEVKRQSAEIAVLRAMLSDSAKSLSVERALNINLHHDVCRVQSALHCLQGEAA